MWSGLPELHCHLDGSLRPSTAAELAAAAGRTVPADLAFSPGMGLDAALARFAFTLSLLQEPAAVARVADEMCADAVAGGVTCLEIRFAPQLHRGGSLAAVVDAAIDGAGGRAGLILCGLYGDPPELLEELVRVAAPRPEVVGLDLAGGPGSGHEFHLADYAAAFAAAARAGLGRTVHAGEGRPPAEISVAIEVLGATRIGHGTTLLEDTRVLDLVLERGVTIEACITSNVHTGAIASVDQHPIGAWIDRGVAVSICADNTFLSATTTRAEHDLALSLPGMTAEKVERAIAAGRASRFRR